MGNLYTGLIRIRNRKIEILTELKYQYKATPRDWNIINDLKEQLKIEEDKEKLNKYKRSLWRGQFG